MKDLVIRAVSQAEFAIAVEWAAAEGWNPGLDDLPAFFAADPGGFLMGFRDGVPVSCISLVRYDQHFAFLGFYIVHVDHRGWGVGIATWHEGMALGEGRTIGLDGVVAQQEKYRKSGFTLAGRNIRYSGVPRSAAAAADGIIRPVTASDMAGLLAYDRAHFPAPRDHFARNWTLPDPAARRATLVLWSDRGTAGYGTIRQCREGYKIGPLFADDASKAGALLGALCRTIPSGSAIVLDVPEDNRAAVRLAEAYGLVATFETARMYCGPPPTPPIQSIFGITTFELG